jgi:hypothetical protein
MTGSWSTDSPASSPIDIIVNIDSTSTPEPMRFGSLSFYPRSSTSPPASPQGFNLTIGTMSFHINDTGMILLPDALDTVSRMSDSAPPSPVSVLQGPDFDSAPSSPTAVVLEATTILPPSPPSTVMPVMITMEIAVETAPMPPIAVVMKIVVESTTSSSTPNHCNLQKSTPLSLLVGSSIDCESPPPSPTTAYCVECNAYHYVGPRDFSLHEISGCNDPRGRSAATYPTVSECGRALNDFVTHSTLYGSVKYNSSLYSDVSCSDDDLPDPLGTVEESPDNLDHNQHINHPLEHSVEITRTSERPKSL